MNSFAASTSEIARVFFIDFLQAKVCLHMNRFFAGLAATAALLFTAAPASAAIVITEVQPSGSDSTYAGDWFELTNTGAAAVDITGWKMDDVGANPVTGATALTGVTSIAAGQSVVFLGSTNTAGFVTAWFGSNVPSGFAIGSFTPNGLGQGGDAVNIYDSSNALIANISYEAATPAVSFDNAVGASGLISTLSVVGTNGAFSSVADFSVTNPIKEIGSPGFAPAAVPEPSTWALLLCGMGGFGLLARRRARA